MEQPFASMIPPPSPPELIDAAFRRARKVEVKVPRRAPGLKTKVKEEAKVSCASSIVLSKLRRVRKSAPHFPSLHPFYYELADILVGVGSVRRALAHVKWGEEMVAKLAKEYLRRVRKAKDGEEAAKARRAFYGRLSSIVEDLEPSLVLLREASIKLKEIPAIDVGGVVVVVAGAPNVGKSSFVRCVSTAKPKVAPYPFTTKNLLIGHLEWRGVRVQIMDTPGLLDRPIHERSPIEKQAIAALRHLAKAAIYIIDPSETSGYDLDQQVRVYRELSRELSSIPFIPALNKVDLAREDQIEKVKQLLGVERLPRMVALRCEGVREVLEEVLELCKVA
ncbi:MAG: 50S ribosome-binding GTPase [Candidatus Nezhaarchaeota archaeon]|nr:50S ribosome-binding GTPase [Candidatus Nezhaarchaeota archaeon]